MTKKFWADWQKRIDETESIRMKFNNDMNGRGYMLFYPDSAKIIKCTFDGDTAELILEKTIHEFNRNMGFYYTKQIETVTINRNNIKTIKFIHGTK